MKKIPTLFERDWNGDKSRVINQAHPGCEWVVTGEGIATRKYDGTCCLIRDGQLWKRREVKSGDSEPLNFALVGEDQETGKKVGWVPVADSTEDKYHQEAFKECEFWRDGTYELLGPKIQGNVEKRTRHILQAHNEAQTYANAPRTFDGLKEWLAEQDIEGLVFHHADGRMAKIKLRDFGLKRKLTGR